MAKRRIGIMGGMGPEATVLLMTRIIAATPARDDRDHIPMIVDNNTQVPSRIEAIIEGTGEDPGPVLAAMARGLQDSGAEALALACNTAHAYASGIQDAVDIPFLDMIELTADRIAKGEGTVSRVGVLASPAVRLAGLYDQAFAKRGIETLYPRDQDRMLAAIRAVKISSGDETARKTLASAAEELSAGGADALIVACSEFSIIADAIDPASNVVDAIDVLAEAVVSFAGSEARDKSAVRPKTA